MHFSVFKEAHLLLDNETQYFLFEASFLILLDFLNLRSHKFQNSVTWTQT